jgi:ABC-type proline/glycine betaine transport system permease subunit
MTWVFIAMIVLAAAGVKLQDSLRDSLRPLVAPLCVAMIGVGLWGLAVIWTGSRVFPGPLQTCLGLAELIESERLWGDIIASLFRVTWGFFLAASVGIPLGLVVGWNMRVFCDRFPPSPGSPSPSCGLALATARASS